MGYSIVAESKAWNKVDFFDGQINILWEKEIDFEILEYQLRDESGGIVFRSEHEEDIVGWLAGEEGIRGV